MKKSILFVLFSGAIATAMGAGFGIYEGSARGNAMGGAILGDVNDATANYHNPAKIAHATNIQVAVGATLIKPYCDVEVEHRSQNRMDPGWFTVPTAYVTIPLPGDFALGWGNYTEFGLGSRYGQDWAVAKDTVETTIEQMTFNPNLAYKITDRWNVSAGLRGSYINFCGYSHPGAGLPGYHLNSKLKGDDWGLGWNAATSFDFNEDWSLGLIYRSKIKHKLKGHSFFSGDVGGTPVAMLHQLGYFPYGPVSPVSGKLELPESVALGVNWNATDRFRMGSLITYTRWSSIKTINFVTPAGVMKEIPLKWHDTVRVGFGFEYDFYDWLCGRVGYAFDRDPSNSAHQSTMLPAGDRHIISLGTGIRLMENLRLDLSYSFIRMNNEHYFVKTPMPNGTVASDYVSVRNGGSHLIGASLIYSF